MFQEHWSGNSILVGMTAKLAAKMQTCSSIRTIQGSGVAQDTNLKDESDQDFKNSKLDV